MLRLAIISLLTYIYLTSLNCSNIESQNWLRYEGFLYKTVAITTDNYQTHTLYIKGLYPKERQHIISIARLLVCYSKSKYLEESLKFYSYETGKSVANLNLRTDRIFIVFIWIDNFNNINPKKRITSMDVASTDKIDLKMYDNSFPHLKVVYNLSNLGMDYDNLKCN